MGNPKTKIKGERKMNSTRKTGIIVGVLFIIATTFLFIGEAFYGPILSSPDYLDNAYPNRIIVIIGILLESIVVPAMVLIPVFLFPILKKHNEVLALGYVCFRLLEGAIFAIGETNKLFLVKVSQDYLSKGAVDASGFQNIGSSIQSAVYWPNPNGLIYIVVFVIGALMFYSVLYESKLIPRFISVWGFIAAVALLTGSALTIFDLYREMTIEILLVTPIAVQEMALAVWLIVKGFNPSAIASLSAKTDTNKV